MRPGVVMAPAAAAGAAIGTASPELSPWHSPVPYLFGGLAAMLGLIAFALLILACSYWRLSGFLDHRPTPTPSASDLQQRKAVGPTGQNPTPYLEKGYVVIMAGQSKPTFLATPVNSRASSFGAKDDEEKSGDSNQQQQ